MDQMLEQVRDTLEGQIDFTGQKLADLLSTWLLIITGIVSFVVGYVQQNVHATVFTGLAGTFLTFLVVVPPWPFFNRNPQPWLDSTTKGVKVEVR